MEEPISNNIIKITALIAVFIVLANLCVKVMEIKRENSKKKYYEITLGSGKVIRDSLKDYKDRFKGDSISYYKNEIISSKEIK